MTDVCDLNHKTMNLLVCALIVYLGENTRYRVISVMVNESAT